MIGRGHELDRLYEVVICSNAQTDSDFVCPVFIIEDKLSLSENVHENSVLLTDWRWSVLITMRVTIQSAHDFDPIRIGRILQKIWRKIVTFERFGLFLNEHKRNIKILWCREKDWVKRD